MECSFDHARFYTVVELKSGVSAKEIHEKLANAFPNSAPGYSSVKRWYKEFKDGTRVSFDHLPHTGAPRRSRTAENAEQIQLLLQQNPRMSTRSLADELQISKQTVNRILIEDLKMRKLCSVWVPHELTAQNKLQRIESATLILQRLEQLGEDAAKRLYAVEDETWVNFDPMLPKQENKCWIGEGDSRQTITKAKITKRKALLLLCFTANKKVVVKTLPYGETVNSEQYIAFLKLVGDRWRSLRRDPTHLRDLSLQHDNARPHTSKDTTRFLQDRDVFLVKQSPYSPDFNLCDRWLFAHLKCAFKHMRFDSADEVKDAALRVFKSTPEERFSTELQKLKDHLHCVIQNNGSYIV